MGTLIDHQSAILLDGDVVLCGCPNCRAPLSVRLWLMSADCWRCGTSIELSDEQQFEVRRLLTAQQRSRSTPPAPSRQPVVLSPPVARQVNVPERRVRQPSSPPDSAAGRRVRRRAAWLDAPPWLASLLLHLAALILLGLLTFQEEHAEYITISTAVGKQVQRGGETLIVDGDREIAFDLPVSPIADLGNRRVREALIKASQDAKKIRLDPNAVSPHLPDLADVRRSVTERPGNRSALAARDPRVRVEMVRREGGTTRTEAAVSRGLFWLARHQDDKGNWSLDGFHRTARCRCSARGGYQSDSAATSLALLPFLGAGQTPDNPTYSVFFCGFWEFLPGPMRLVDVRSF
jgi:hypothetical protein